MKLRNSYQELFGYPNILQPKGVCKIVGIKPDSLSLNPWSHGKALIWDVTVVDKLNYLTFICHQKHMDQ